MKKILRHLRETLTITREVRQQSTTLHAAISDVRASILQEMRAQDESAQARSLTLEHSLTHAISQDLAGDITQLRQEQGNAASDLRGLHQQMANIDDLLNRLLLRQIKSDSQLAADGDRPISVHFFFQSPETWTTWESVWESCVAHPRINPLMVLIPFIHDSSEEDGKARRFLADQGLPFRNMSAYDLHADAPDIVFLQNPYDSTRPPKLAVSHIVASGARIAYVPYGLDVGGGAQNLAWQYDLEVQRNAWRIFVRSEQHRRMYGLQCEAGNQHVVVTGHPKIDKIVEKAAEGRDRSTAAQSSKVLLWTPHFSVEDGGWSTFFQYADEMLSYFEKKPAGIRLVIRPHPLFFGRLRQQSPKSGMSEDEFLQRVAAAPSIEFDQEPQYLESFRKSDALMADAGSFLLEYLPTEKPILYLHNASGPGLNETGDFVEHYEHAAEFRDVRAFIEMIQEGRDERRESRLAQIERVLHRIDGKVGESIVEHIVENFGASLSGVSFNTVLSRI